ncbi:MAG TPA: 50S ribosomal protein L28 [Clostridiales bacterium]|nr:MAG: 50S ribosomal protein L28 [Clostridiales bacterium GWD2_32_59]HAN09897.1 50S ribosomal protein L28 [Clostridiales bacterium]
MAKCSVCEKGSHFGNKVSHSHRRSNKEWKANVKKVRVNANGTNESVHVCTKCLKSGLVDRV